MQYILASASPRRREILASLGLDFTVLVADADESCHLTDPGARVETISSRKCLAARDKLLSAGMPPADSETLLIASDTLVVLDGCFLGKPRDREDALHMIRRLRGHTHVVASGLALWHKGELVTAHELTRVTFAPMSEEETLAYVDTGEPFGKAGGYAIQGKAARYITGIQGDYFNVVGLPVRRLYETLWQNFGLRL